MSDEISILKNKYNLKQQQWEQEKQSLQQQLQQAQQRIQQLEAQQQSTNNTPSQPPIIPPKPDNAHAAVVAARKLPPIPTTPSSSASTSQTISTTVATTSNQLIQPVSTLKPLIPFTIDSPFFRKDLEEQFAKVQHLSSRLKRIISKAKEFCSSLNKFSEVSNQLSAELSASWNNVEQGFDDEIPIRTGQENPSLSAVMGKLGAMLATVSDISTNLSFSVDAFLVSVLGKQSANDVSQTVCISFLTYFTLCLLFVCSVDFRTKHVESCFESEKLLDKATQEYENAVDKKLNRKKIQHKDQKKAEQEQESIKLELGALATLKRQFELLRFDHTATLIDVLTHRRIDLVEMSCASFLSFSNFFREGRTVADLLKSEVDSMNSIIAQKRPIYRSSC